VRVRVSGIYYTRNKTKCNYITGDPCLVNWKNKAENMSGFLHAAFDTSNCHCHPCTLSFACNPWLCKYLIIRAEGQCLCTYLIIRAEGQCLDKSHG